MSVTGTRVGGGVATAAIAAGAAHEPRASWASALLAGWDAAAIVVLGAVWLSIHALDAAATRRKASEQDSQPAAEVAVIGAGAASLIAVIFVLAQARASSGWGAAHATIFAIVSIALAWLLVQVVSVLQYARHYYASPIGGIDLGTEPRPTEISPIWP